MKVFVHRAAHENRPTHNFLSNRFSFSFHRNHALVYIQAKLFFFSFQHSPNVKCSCFDWHKYVSFAVSLERNHCYSRGNFWWGDEENNGYRLPTLHGRVGGCESGGMGRTWAADGITSSMTTIFIYIHETHTIYFGSKFLSLTTNVVLSYLCAAGERDGVSLVRTREVLTAVIASINESKF